MNDALSAQNIAEDLSETEVRNYLEANPEFFVKHIDLLEKLQFAHPHKGAVSLVEMQSEQFRSRIQQLTKKLNQLIDVAKQNEKIYRVYVSLSLKLMKCKDVNDVQTTVELVMQEELGLSSVHIKPFSGDNALTELQQRQLIDKRFRTGPFFFGRLSDHEKQVVFSSSIAESVALVLIGDEAPIAILAIGSDDPTHFAPSMDTLMLKQLQQMLNILLHDFLS
ncbi:DUF484 family protein [Alteromonas sp. 5E99-2]|uniref:DUF484 family protein n=1 Tax=Alteromonas sp. 5E99-2 TaxID=2817683 RepID=UPI001A98E7DC|nr:DUF484 family protein [Alteromonas sp. 5E99-2]MBO1255880.1 DUF484 family protein [Alteromonas sp. 5E99-2]